MDLSIIIVSFNTRKLLYECLSSVFTSLKDSPFKSEVIVVDNGSTDGSKEMVKKKFSSVSLVSNQENVGFGKANNQGIRRARGEYILLLNSDTVIQDKALDKLFEFSKEHPDVFAGPKLFNVDGSAQTSTGPFLTLPIAFLVLFLKGDRLGITRWSPNRIRYVDWVSGACIISFLEASLIVRIRAAREAE